MLTTRAVITTLLAAMLVATAACGIFEDREAAFKKDLEDLGYTVDTVEYETETDSNSVVEARVAISDGTDPDCYVEFERDYNETKTATVDGIEMRIFKLDEVEDEKGKELDTGTPPNSPTPDETLTFLQAEGSKLDFCLAG